MVTPGGPDDKVVREIDVYFCAGVLGTSTKLMLLQYPLRPQWRTYDHKGFNAVRVKPRAMKMEMEAPLAGTGSNYNSDAEKHKKFNKLLLTSDGVDMGTTFACGSVRDNKLLLTPLDGVLQLRPSFAHLDAALAGPAADGAAGRDARAEEAGGEAGGSGLVPLTVQVKKRENERQAAARMSSYAYLQAQVEEEPWVEVAYHDSNSLLAEGVWEKMMTAPSESEVDMSVSRGAYLEAIVPGLSGRAVAEAAAAAAAVAEQASLALGRPEALGAPGKAVSREAETALPVVVQALYRHQAVCNLKDIRAFLERFSEAGAAREFVDAGDVQLHDALVACPFLTSLRRVYVLTKLNNAALDPLRSLVIGLFEDKESLKRAEILQAAKTAGLTINDSLYNKVMRTMCESKGGQWSLKTGADM